MTSCQLREEKKTNKQKKNLKQSVAKTMITSVAQKKNFGRKFM